MSRPDTGAKATTPETGETFYITRTYPRPYPPPLYSPGHFLATSDPAFQGTSSLPFVLALESPLLSVPPF